MNIAVLVKIVPDDEDILVNADGSLDFSKAKNAISTYDLNAIEAAAQLAAANGAHLTAIAVGPKSIDDTKTRKNILSRGVDDLCILNADELEMADAFVTGSAIAAIVKKLGNIDLIIAGDGSADYYAQQVDVQVAEQLGWPNLNAAVELRVDGDALVVKRLLEREEETDSMALPAVVAVAPDAALPRIAGMKDILAAGKKPVTSFTVADLDWNVEPTVETVEVRAPKPAPRKQILLDGSSDEDIDKFVAALREAI